MLCAVVQLCPMFRDPINCSLPGYSVHGILQARMLEWVAMPSSRASSWPRDWTSISWVSCIGRKVLYHGANWEAQSESEIYSVVSDSLWPLGLYSPWNFPGQNTGVGSHFLLQGIFPALGLNPGLLHCRQILYQLNHQGSLWWVLTTHKAIIPGTHRGDVPTSLCSVHLSMK